MSEPAVVVASPPRRPPPPSVQKNQEVGVANHRQLKERKDSRDDILIVDSRSKSKSKSKPPFEDTSLTGVLVKLLYVEYMQLYLD